MKKYFVDNQKYQEILNLLWNLFNLYALMLKIKEKFKIIIN